MRTAILGIGGLLLLLGLLWAGQGANLIGGSFMTGQSTWLLVGLAVAAAGLILVSWAIFGDRRFPKR